eukprot:scaffold3513_cov127-Isochrysis_galbana.AAC.13
MAHGRIDRVKFVGLSGCSMCPVIMRATTRGRGLALWLWGAGDPGILGDCEFITFYIRIRIRLQWDSSDIRADGDTQHHEPWSWALARSISIYPLWSYLVLDSVVYIAVAVAHSTQAVAR